MEYCGNQEIIEKASEKGGGGGINMQLIVNTETPSSALERVGGRIKIRNRYDNFIGGAWVPPAQGRYF